MAESLDHHIPSIKCANCETTLKIFNKVNLWHDDIYYSSRNFVISYAYSCYWKKSELPKLLKTIGDDVVCTQCHKIRNAKIYQCHQCKKDFYSAKTYNKKKYCQQCLA